jgi:predicted porin
MNMKKTALALAVASVAAAPIIAAAEGALYGSMRYGFETKSDGLVDAVAAVAQVDHGTPGVPASPAVAAVAAGNQDNTVSQFKNFGSRFGIKGETDLGNGLTAFGKWEAHMFGAALRDFQVGLKGDFGVVYMGDGIDHAWDTVMSTDNTWWYGGVRHLTDGIQSNAITYQNTFGAVSIGATVRMKPEDDNDLEEDVDQYELVASFAAGPINIGLGVSDIKTNVADPEPTLGFIVGGENGGFVWALDYQMQDAETGDADKSSLQIDVGFGSFYGQYGMQETDGLDPEPFTIVLGYTHTIGPRTLMYFEYAGNDPDNDTQDTENIFAAVLKYDIL